MKKTTPKEAIIYYGKLFGVKVDPTHILKEVLLEESATLTLTTSQATKTQKGLAHSLVTRQNCFSLKSNHWS
jgi:hypothetical protein